MRIVTDSGMVVDRRGAGPAVLLIHGVGGPLMWEKLVPLLARSRDVVLPHLRGFGDSPAPEGTMSSDDHAAALAGLIESMCLEQATVVGVSYGGHIAARLAARAAPKIARLVLVCPTGMRGDGWSGKPGRMLRRALVGDRSRRVTTALLSFPPLAEFASRRSFFNLANRPHDLVARYLGQLSKPGHANALFDAVREITLDPGAVLSLIREFSLPVTFVAGENDRVVPPPDPSGWTDAVLPGGFRDVRILPDCGHSVPMEKPESLAGIITRAPS
jgi:pimeloyl-ACP methyl ester carboxylesterase